MKPEPMTTIGGLRQRIDRELLRPAELDSPEYLRLAPDDREIYDRARLSWFGSQFQLKSDHAHRLVTTVRGIVETNDLYVPGECGVVLTGPAHIGKTTMLLGLAKELERVSKRKHATYREDGHVPVVYVEVTANATPKSVASSIIDFFGVPHSPRATQAQLVGQATSLLLARHTEVLLIDEVQMLKLNGTKGDSAVDTFKSIMNDSGCVCVFSGIDLTSRLTSRPAEQIIARCEVIEVDPFTIANAEDRNHFASVIDTFENQMLLIGAEPSQLQEHAQLLFIASQGRIGTLRRILRAAHFRAIRMPQPDGRRRRIEAVGDLVLAQITSPGPNRAGVGTDNARRAA